MVVRRQEQADEYHKQFADSIIEALKEGTAPWQKPWIWHRPSNFRSGNDYHGGNALYLAIVALDRGYVDPRWGTFLQIREAGGRVRKDEVGSLIWFWQDSWLKLARDETGTPVLDEEGRPKLEWVERPFEQLSHVFNVEQTEGLQLRRLLAAPSKWKGHKRAEGLIRSSGIRVDHVAGDRAYYRLSEDRVVLPERRQFRSQAVYTHTALHELGHATGHPNRLNRPTLVHHDGFGSEKYAREELRAEIAAMMTGDKLGIGHAPQHGNAYLDSWIHVLENHPAEIYDAAGDAQRISDWLLAREPGKAEAPVGTIHRWKDGYRQKVSMRPTKWVLVKKNRKSGDWEGVKGSRGRIEKDKKKRLKLDQVDDPRRGQIVKKKYQGKTGLWVFVHPKEFIEYTGGKNAGDKIGKRALNRMLEERD